MAFSKEVWSILPGPYTPCLSRFSNACLLPSLLCSQKSVTFTAMSAFPEHFIMLRHTQSLTTVEIREPQTNPGNHILWRVFPALGCSKIAWMGFTFLEKSGQEPSITALNGPDTSLGRFCIQGSIHLCRMESRWRKVLAHTLKKKKKEKEKRCNRQAMALKQQGNCHQVITVRRHDRNGWIKAPTTGSKTLPTH